MTTEKQSVKHYRMQKKLNKNGVQYTDEEIELIRNVLYKLAEVYHSNKNKKYDNRRIESQIWNDNP
ncbi:hypothetical protein [Flavobacterium sp. ZS1P14]|uniref:hypothetical protein n=1 Tax=Flavobacterium sp. ZS1P14 TaxID=3401729 RepID=UPI003AAE4F82